ncbi:hypothetical protein YC2023_095732 [Brassica napus]
MKPTYSTEEEDKSGPETCLYVKVSMEGAPYLRKIDLKTYKSYVELSSALEKMFSCFTLVWVSWRVWQRWVKRESLDRSLAWFLSMLLPMKIKTVTGCWSVMSLGRCLYVRMFLPEVENHEEL